MSYIGWYFSELLDAGEEGYTSNDIEAFKGVDLYVNLAREICQNSLDSREKDSGEPVEVVFNLRKYKTSSFSIFSEYKDCLDRCRRYWTQRADGIDARLDKLLTRAQSLYATGVIPVMVISDYNTPGLKGSKNLTQSFNALVYGQGTSYKDSDTSGGSYGIGRNAPFACSALSCVCYNTKAVDGGEAFAGVAKLATIQNQEGRPTHSLGKYQFNDNENKVWRPIRPNDGDLFAEEFKRSRYGTDVIVLGFEETEDWEKQLEKAVLNNFYVAINRGQLSVTVQDTLISRDTMQQVIERFLLEDPSDTELKRTHLYLKALNDPSSSHYDLSILNGSACDSELFICTDNEVEGFKNVAWLRNSGMHIKHFHPYGLLRPYVGVFIAKGELDKVLRSTEPARHNDWDYQRAGEARSEERKIARNAISKLKAEIKRCLLEACEIDIEESIDAEGAAEYLPDQLEGSAPTGGGTDLLRPLISLGRAKKASKKSSVEEQRGRKGTGAITEGDVGNRRRNPDPDPLLPPPPKPVIPGIGEEAGVVPGRGGKVITKPISGMRRTYAINPSVGIYKMVFIPESSEDRAFIVCKAIGENGKAERVLPVSAKRGGRSLTISDKGIIGPVSITEGERVEIITTFKDHEDMALSVEFSAGE